MKKEIENNIIPTPWLSSYDGMREHLEYPTGSLYEEIEKTANKYPNYIAYQYFSYRATYKEFLNSIRMCAKAFKNIGIEKDEVVTICMPNTPESIIAFYALNMIGAIANMVHPLSSENEIKYFLEKSKSAAILVIDLAWEKISHIVDNTNVRYSIVVSVKDSMTPIMGMGYWITKGRKIKKADKSAFVLNWHDFITKAHNYLGKIKTDRTENDIAAILYSGGTTGNPKGIMLSNKNFNAVAIQGIEAVGCAEPKISVLAIMPIFHGFGLGICFHTTLCFGGTSIILPQFSSKDFHKLIKKYRPNIIAGVPTLYEALIQNKHMKNMDLSFVKCAISGGDSLSVSLKRKIDVFLEEHNCKIQVREGYGLTECVTGSCLTPIKKYKEGSIGVPYPDTYYKIIKPDTHTTLPYGEIGEICISGPTVMLGYLDEPKETLETLQTHEDGKIWLHTGDLGYMDEEGFIYFKQRLKRMIVSSGYNIYPQYIENVIDSYPDVLISTVIGIPHPYKGQVAKAFIVLKKDIQPSEKIKRNIIKYCEKNIAAYSMPKEFVFRDDLPRTLVGKVAYKELEKEELEEKKDN